MVVTTTKEHSIVTQTITSLPSIALKTSILISHLLKLVLWYTTMGLPLQSCWEKHVYYRMIRNGFSVGDKYFFLIFRCVDLYR
jgi:hypothetical protein